MSIQPPPLLWTGLISSGSSFPLSSPVLLHITFKHILLEDSNLEQSNIVLRSILYSSWLMKMLNSEAFYTLVGNIPAIFLIYLEHSCYLLSTFDVHSKYSNCILFEFFDARTVFGSHSGSILTAFIHHSRHLPILDLRRYSRSNQSALMSHLKWILNIMTAFSFLNIPTVFQLHSSCIWELIHSVCARII